MHTPLASMLRDMFCLSMNDIATNAQWYMIFTLRTSYFLDLIRFYRAQGAAVSARIGSRWIRCYPVTSVQAIRACQTSKVRLSGLKPPQLERSMLLLTSGEPSTQGLTQVSHGWLVLDTSHMTWLMLHWSVSPWCLTRVRQLWAPPSGAISPPRQPVSESNWTFPSQSPNQRCCFCLFVCYTSVMYLCRYC